MVEDRLSDGKRIAQLLASEIDGLGGVLEAVAVVEAEPDVEPTADGAFAYGVAMGGEGVRDGTADGGRVGDGTADDERVSDETTDHDSVNHECVDNTGTHGSRIAEVYVQPDRARVEFVAVPDVAADAADEQDLRVRPKASRPPRTLVFVEDGAEVKRAVAVVKAVLQAVE